METRTVYCGLDEMLSLACPRPKELITIAMEYNVPIEDYVFAVMYEGDKVDRVVAISTDSLGVLTPELILVRGNAHSDTSVVIKQRLNANSTEILNILKEGPKPSRKAITLMTNAVLYNILHVVENKLCERPLLTSLLKPVLINLGGYRIFGDENMLPTIMYEESPVTGVCPDPIEYYEVKELILVDPTLLELLKVKYIPIIAHDKEAMFYLYLTLTAICRIKLSDIVEFMSYDFKELFKENTHQIKLLWRMSHE